MAKPVSIDFSRTEDKGFYVDPGKYSVKLKEASQEMGQEYPFILFKFEVAGHGVTLSHRATLKPDALFNLKNTLAALLGREIPKATVNIDLDKLIGRMCTATVADREYNGKVYSNITRLEAYVPPANSTSGDLVDDLASL